MTFEIKLLVEFFATNITFELGFRGVDKSVSIQLALELKDQLTESTF